MQVALYARVSTNQQEKTDTIESQVEALHTYVAAHGHTVLPEHLFLDNGVSGSRLDRPALDRLRDQARLGEFEAVIILSPDRLARSYPHQWVLLEEFKKYGCRVIFMENPFGDSPHGQLLAQMQRMIAEYERTQIADRTRRGRLHKAQKGEFLPWAYRAYGYRYIPKQAGLLPRVELHPDQAPVVRDMFHWLIHEQLTTRQIVKRLNALKIPTQTGQNAVWHVASVRCMLSNPIYTGQGHYNRTRSGVPRKERRRKFHPRTDNYAREPRPSEEWVPITAPALISAETFAKAQEQLKQNRIKARRAYQPTSQRYLLRTLVRCGLCQLHMQAARQRSVCKRYEYLYYCCAGKDAVTVGRVDPCPSRRVRADRLDTLVWTLVRELLQEPQSILQEYALWQHVQQGQQGQFHDQLQRIDMQSQHLERQLQRLIDAYQQEVITLQDLSTRREQIVQRLKGFEQERQNVEQQRDATIKWEHIADNIDHFRALLGRNLDRLSFEDRQAVVQLLVEKVVVHPDGAVDVHHVLPFEEQPVVADQKKKGCPAEFYVLRLKHLPVIQGVEDDIEEVEEQVFSPDRTNPVERIYYLKREVLEFRRATAPLLTPLMQLSTQPLPHVCSEVRPYFRDVYDHLLRINEQIDAFRDLLTSVLEANLTQVSVRQNEDMRKISAWVAIVAVPTMIAGIYGMNFQYMPELTHPLGYPIIMGLIVSICVSLYVCFRRWHWL